MKFKDFLKKKGISEDDFKAKSPDEMAELYSEYMEALGKDFNEKLKDAASQDDIDKAVKGLLTADDLKDYATKKQIEDLNKTITDLEEKANKFAEEGIESNKSGMTLRESIKQSLLKQKDALIALKDNSKGSLKLVVSKAAVPMTFATNTTGQVGRVERMAGIVGPLRRTPALMDIVNVSTTNANLFEWIEKTGHDGGVTMVAEGTVKPQGDWDLELHSQKPKKAAIIVTVSKEMLDDIDGLAQDIEEEIYDQIREFTEEAILDGDGLTNNIEGIDANATAFVAGTFANTVVSANQMDAIRVAINQVILNNDYPTYILMHPSDATAMELVKDSTTNQYILPPFVAANGANVSGIPIKVSTVVTQGEAYVGNFNRFKVKIREEITFDVGYRGLQGDWEKNMISFLGEERLFAFIPENHYGSIVKIDLDVAMALLDPDVADA